MARAYGGQFSPKGQSEPAAGGAPAPQRGGNPFRNKRARNVNIWARLLFLAPLPLLMAGLGSIRRGQPIDAAVELAALATLLLGAYLLNDGLKAEAAYNARKIARPPGLPRKMIAAALAGLGVFLAGWLVSGQGLLGGVIFGALATLAHLFAFGLDPLAKKGLEGVDEFEVDRVARAIEKAEGTVAEITAAAARIGDRRLTERVEGFAERVREVFRVVEEDPRDLTRARKFLGVYLVGARDATTKFADLYSRERDEEARAEYEALLTDLEQSFDTHRADLLSEDKVDLDVEIEVLRERLQRERPAD